MADIIIIEDDTSLQMLYGTIASNLDITHYIMGSLAEAASWLKTAIAAPKLIVLDNCLPDGNGIAFAQQLRDHFPIFDAPIIALASGLQRAEMHIDAPSINHFIAKPFSLQQMTQLFQQCCETEANEPIEPMSHALRDAFIVDLRIIADDLTNDFCDQQIQTQRRLHSLIAIAGMLGDMSLSAIARKAHNARPAISKLERKLTIFRIAARAQMLADTLGTAQPIAAPPQRQIA